MNNQTILRNVILSTTTAILLTACGGGGGEASESNTNAPNSKTIINAKGTSIDYSSFAWGIINSSNIDSSFKTTYGIDSSADINLAAAWSKSKGKKSNNEAIKVAIIDEDFEVSHPDINHKILSTYNVMDNSTNVSDTDGDTYYHGLATAGFIASESLGVSPEVELILINIDLDSENLTDIHLIKAFDYAKQQDAKVINCSWGGSQLSNIVQNKIQELKNAGITIVFASGNGDSLGNAINLDLLGNDDPSELDTVIGVGATSVKNDVTSYSNYGSSIDILAPGGGGVDGGKLLGMLGLDATGNLGRNNSSDTIVGNNLVSNNYTFTAGTSFSAPVASGVIALMLAVNENLTVDRIREILIKTSTKVNNGSALYIDKAGDGTTSTFDTKRAYGKINAGAAVQEAENDMY